MTAASVGVVGGSEATTPLEGTNADLRYAMDRPDVVEELIAAELVVISFKTGKYHGIRGSGVAIWQQLDAGWSVAEITRHAAKSYVGFDAEAARQIASFVGELEAQQLIARATREPSPLEIEPASDHGGAFVGPELESRADLQDHLTLDPIHDVDEYGWPRAKP